MADLHGAHRPSEPSPSNCGVVFTPVLRAFVVLQVLVESRGLARL
jgi:hypothetical protein